VKQSDELRSLVAEARALEDDPRNKIIKRAWLSMEPGKLAQAHGIPLSSSAVDQIPFTVELEPDLWARIFGFNIETYMTDARVFLENFLRMMIYRFVSFRDFTPIELTIPMTYGVVMESSLFGAEPIFKADQAPWVAREPRLRVCRDLERMRSPDFYRSGIMPLVHRMYGELVDLAEGQMDIIFPRWIRSPFGLATQLRGFENILTDFYLNPQFVRDLMRFLTDAQKAWETERAAFTGTPIIPAILANDEVNCPALSAALYEDFILPFEVELSHFYHGIGYWHSCGNTTELVPSIAKIPGLEVFHIGPWTNEKTARDAMANGTAFEKCLHPVEDVYRATPQEMAQRLDGIRASLDGTSYTVRADGFEPMNGMERDLGAIRRWIEVAEERLRNPSTTPRIG
jgi:uroporphyrinogen-III decarboxylase